MQSPSVDITNMNTTHDSAKAVDEYKQVVERATAKMFETANIMLDENESIEKVIILDRTPRCDSRRNDPCELKPKLAEYGNQLNKVELEKAKHRNKIVIGKHNFRCDDDIYGNVNDRFFDAIHMNGPNGSEGYTKSLINILRENLECQPGHVHFPVAERARTSQPGPEPSKKSATSSTPVSKPSNPSLYQYAVKTFNKFSTLLN